MDIYRKPRPGAPSNAVATGHVDVGDEGIAFAAM
jgi:hypothetical protein